MNVALIREPLMCLAYFFSVVHGYLYKQALQMSGRLVQEYNVVTVAMSYFLTYRNRNEAEMNLEQLN